MRACCLLMLLLMVVSCGKEKARKSSESKQNVSAIYASKKLNIKVYYEEGAQPYADKVLTLELWQLLRSNMEALLEGRDTEINVPGDLAEMTRISAQNKASWTVDDVLKLAEANPVSKKSGTTDFQIFFLKGHHENNPGVIGFHISNTKVMAIFKDVIRSSGSGQQEIVPKYVEQATLIHEMGHALGLVNNGLSMKHKHQDTENGAHCSNPDCVMYYANEGAASMIKFAIKAKEKLSPVMFDSHCLEDARSYKK